jgi:hypothetical protein
MGHFSWRPLEKKKADFSIKRKSEGSVALMPRLGRRKSLQVSGEKNA